MNTVPLQQFFRLCQLAGVMYGKYYRVHFDVAELAKRERTINPIE